MEKLLRLLSAKNKIVVTYYEVDFYDIVVVQDTQGNALYVQALTLDL